MLKRLLDRIGSLIGKDAKQRQSVKPQKPQGTPVPKQGGPGNYHCVEVHCGSTGCGAARSLAGIRFLPHEAPALPVPECTNATCTCAYVHHEDRREDDRRNPYRQWALDLPDISSERRARNDRRKSADKAFKPTMTP
jgi:hypothetical protein